MTKHSVLVLLIVLSISGFAQDLSVSNIPENLKKNADAVLRFSNTTYEIKSINHIKEHVHYAITIMNTSDADKAILQTYYNSRSSISNIDAYLYNANGHLVRKLKKKDLRDIAINNSYTLFGDTRTKYIDFRYNYYPYTIEFEYTRDHYGLISYPAWCPRNNFHYAVQNAKLTIITSNTNLIRIKQTHANEIENRFTANKGKITTTWEVNNLPAIVFEKNAVNIKYFSPTVLLAPSNFAYENTHGNLSTWENYGQWVNFLLQDRDKLDKETIAFIKKLTDSIPTIKDKVNKIYKFHQDKNRYVNISLGIGGFQPLKASEVDKNSYGDCKALSNYMKALLKAIGIKSYYTEIGNGRTDDNLYNDFSSASKTNHVILMVPNGNDSIWLECTSNDYPANFIGQGNANKNAVVITEDGGKLIKTPVYTEQDNIKTSLTSINILPNQEIEITHQQSCKGLYFSPFISLKKKSKEEQSKYLLKTLDVPGLILNDFLYECPNNKAEGKFNIHIGSKTLISKAGKRIFVPLNILNKFKNPYQKKDRETNILIEMAYTNIDTTWVEIPQNLSLDFIPEDIHYHSIMGEYKLETEIINTQLRCVRKMVQNSGTFPKENYNEIRDYYKRIEKSDRQKLIFITN